MSSDVVMRQVSPRIVELLVDDPALIGAVKKVGRPSLPGLEDLPLPEWMASTMKTMPEDQRADFQKSLSETWQAMLTEAKGTLVEGALAMERRRLAQGREDLQRLGVSQEDLREPLGIGYAWYGLNFLITGKARVEPELGATIAVGSGFEADSLHCLSPHETARAAARLEALSRDELASRYDPDAMMRKEIYPEDQWEKPESCEWLLDVFEEVRDYFIDARARGYAMVTYYT